jgi:Anticodon-binding domain
MPSGLTIGMNCRLSITVTTGATYTGTLLSVDSSLNIAGLNTDTPSSTPAASASTLMRGSFQLINTAQITGFNVVSPSSNGVASLASILPTGPVDIKAARAREEQAVRRLQDLERNTNKNVSRDVQELFDALSRACVHPSHISSILFPRDSMSHAVRDEVIVWLQYRPHPTFMTYPMDEDLECLYIYFDDPSGHSSIVPRPFGVLYKPRYGSRWSKLPTGSWRAGYPA